MNRVVRSLRNFQEDLHDPSGRSRRCCAGDADGIHIAEKGIHSRPWNSHTRVNTNVFFAEPRTGRFKHLLISTSAHLAQERSKHLVSRHHEDPQLEPCCHFSRPSRDRKNNLYAHRTSSSRSSDTIYLFVNHLFPLVIPSSPQYDNNSVSLSQQTLFLIEKRHFKSNFFVAHGTISVSPSACFLTLTSDFNRKENTRAQTLARTLSTDLIPRYGAV